MINGDERASLPLLRQFMYFPQCILHHHRGRKTKLPIRPVALDLDFQQSDIDEDSPSGILCRAFCNGLDYGIISHELGGKIHFFDIGCGSGRHGPILKKLAGKNFGSYTGLDIHKNKNFPKNFRHITSDAVDANKHIGKKINFIFSEASLEHIEKDIESLRGVTRRLLENGKPFMQVHLVPAAACLWLYLWHGWRQYSYRNLCELNAELATLGPIKAYATPIGGVRSFFTHLFTITSHDVFYRSLMGNRSSRWNDHKNARNRVIASATRDSHVRGSAFTHFWAFVITGGGCKPVH